MTCSLVCKRYGLGIPERGYNIIIIPEAAEHGHVIPISRNAPYMHTKSYGSGRFFFSLCDHVKVWVWFCSFKVEQSEKILNPVEPEAVEARDG